MKSNIYTKDLTVFQLRAARRALNLTVREVAKELNFTPNVIVRAEKGNLYEFPSRSTVISVSKLRALFEEHGIVFLPNNTIRLEKIMPEVIFRPFNQENTPPSM